MVTLRAYKVIRDFAVDPAHKYVEYLRADETLKTLGDFRVSPEPFLGKTSAGADS